MNNKKNPCIPIQPNSNLKPGSIFALNRVAYQVQNNNTACVIGAIRKRKGSSCPKIGVTMAYNTNQDQTTPFTPFAQIVDGQQGVIYSNNFNGVPNPGAAPYTYTFVSGTLPPGVSPNLAGIYGTPAGTGDFEFTIRATDANGCNGTQVFRLHIRG